MELDAKSVDLNLSRVEYLKRKAKSKFSNFRKKAGDDKLIITLVLCALGVGLCIVYRNSIYTTMTSALSTLSTDITSLLSGTVSDK